MHRSTLPLILVGALGLLAIPASAAYDPTTGFDRITGHYEAIRQALLHDTIDGVPAAAGEIQRDADALESELSEAAAGVAKETVDELRDILPAVRTATHQLQSADELDQARAAFGALSKALVRYRRLVADPEPVVAFCSMAQEVWLQPKGEIGNPYYGQSMARCGEIVSE